MPIFKNGRRLALALAGLLAFSGAALAQATRPQVRDIGSVPESAIYIGNSFNNGISGHVTNLLRGAGDTWPFRSMLVTISGLGADWHDVASDFRPNAIRP